MDLTNRELPKPALLRWGAVLFTLFVLALQISIAASQAFLAAAGILYAIHLLRGPTQILFPPVKLPLALFCLLSVNSIFWSENPAAGGFVVRKLVLFLIWLLALNLVFTARHLQRLLLGLYLVSFVTSLVSIGQFIIQYRSVRASHAGDIYHIMTSTRTHGFMGHWMHFGGQQMMLFASLLAFLLLSKAANGKPREPDTEGESPRKVAWDQQPAWLGWMVLVLVVVSIILNFTRGVWLGCFLGAIYLLLRWRPKWLVALPILVALAYLASPHLIRERFHMAMHPTREPALSIRLEMWRVAVQMIRAHPWVGVGPSNIEEVYDLYLPPRTTPEKGYHNHLHNDFLQFGAERGLPCLIAWVWLMMALAWHTWKLRRRLFAQKWIADAALATLLAFLAEGCFEFNFGSSPVLMLFLFVSATPFIAARLQADSTQLPSGK